MCGVVVGCQPLQPVRGDGAEAVGVGRVTGDGEGRLAAPLGLRAARAHRPVPTSTTPSLLPPVPRSARRAGRSFKREGSSLVEEAFCSSSEGRPKTDRLARGEPLWLLRGWSCSTAGNRPISRPIASGPGRLTSGPGRSGRTLGAARQLVGREPARPGEPRDVLEVDQSGQVDLQLGVAEPGGVSQLTAGEARLGPPGHEGLPGRPGAAGWPGTSRRPWCRARWRTAGRQRPRRPRWPRCRSRSCRRR